MIEIGGTDFIGTLATVLSKWGNNLSAVFSPGPNRIMRGIEEEILSNRFYKGN